MTKVDDYSESLKVGDKFINKSSITEGNWSRKVEIPIGTIFEIYKIDRSSKFGTTSLFYKYRYNGEHTGMFMVRSVNASKCVMYLRDSNLDKLGII